MCSEWYGAHGESQSQAATATQQRPHLIGAMPAFGVPMHHIWTESHPLLPPACQASSPASGAAMVLDGCPQRLSVKFRSGPTAPGNCQGCSCWSSLPSTMTRWDRYQHSVALPVSGRDISNRDASTSLLDFNHSTVLSHSPQLFPKSNLPGSAFKREGSDLLRPRD